MKQQKSCLFMYETHKHLFGLVLRKRTPQKRTGTQHDVCVLRHKLDLLMVGSRLHFQPIPGTGSIYELHMDSKLQGLPVCASAMLERDGK